MGTEWKKGPTIPHTQEKALLNICTHPAGVKFWHSRGQNIKYLEDLLYSAKKVWLFKLF